MTDKMPKFNKSVAKTVWVPLGDLYIKWQTAQRALSEPHVKFIAETLDLNLLDVIHISLPVPSKHHIIDGHHRIMAMRAFGFGEDYAVPCVMHQVADAASCARLFYKLNTGRRAPKAIDKYLSGVTSGFEDHVAVDKIVRDAGYVVANANDDHVIRSAGALMSAYGRFGGPILAKALVTIRETWGKDQNSMTGGIIIGYSLFINQHADEVDYARLADRMCKDYTPGRLTGKARALREIIKGSEGNAVASLITDAYNVGLRGKRLSNGRGTEAHATA